MKTTLLLLMLFMFTPGQAPRDRIIGRWKLEKVVIGSSSIYPEDLDFYLTISKDAITYNPDCINKCWANITSLNDTSIITNGVGCTLALCRPKKEIFDYMNYSGNYTLHDSILIITNEQGKHYLIKQP